MNDTPTPITNRAVADSNGQWSFVLRNCSQQLERELAAITEQRDRLAKALLNCMPYITCEGMGEYHDAREALQSLTTNHFVDANNMVEITTPDHFPDVGNMIATNTQDHFIDISNMIETTTIN
jgi:hypothetical protein